MQPFYKNPVNKSRHAISANSLTWAGVNLVLNQWSKQKLCVSYFTEIISGSFGDGPVNKSRHYVLDILLGLFKGGSVTNQWIKADIMCYLPRHFFRRTTTGPLPNNTETNSVKYLTHCVFLNNWSNTKYNPNQVSELAII